MPAQRRPDLEFIGESSVQRQIAAPALSLRQVAGRVRPASLIHGETNDDKLVAMTSAPSAATRRCSSN